MMKAPNIKMFILVSILFFMPLCGSNNIPSGPVNNNRPNGPKSNNSFNQAQAAINRLQNQLDSIESLDSQSVFDLGQAIEQNIITLKQQVSEKVPSATEALENAQAQAKEYNSELTPSEYEYMIPQNFLG